MISLQNDHHTEKLKLDLQEEKSLVSLRKVNLLVRTKEESSQKTLHLIKMTEGRHFLKLILQRSLDLNQTAQQSTLFHTQIFALKKKVSLLIKAML